MSDVTLAVSASGRRYAVALRTADGAIHSGPAESGGAADLTAGVADLCATHGVAATGLTGLLVDVGPGSYTGLRVAVTFARVVAAFRDIPIGTVTSLELAALAAWDAGTVAIDRILRPVLDARRDRFHHAPVRLADGRRVELVAEPQATPFAELAAAVDSAEYLLAEDALHERLRPLAAAVVTPTSWDAALLFDGRLAPRATDLAALEPLYLMGSYAEQ